MNNLNTDKPSSLYEAFEPKEAKRIWDRFEFVFTPKHGSWLNMAEIELNVLNGRCLNKMIDNINTVKQEVEVWLDYRNNKNSVINWRFEIKAERIKLKRLYPSIEGRPDASVRMKTHNLGVLSQKTSKTRLSKLLK